MKRKIACVAGILLILGWATAGFAAPVGKLTKVKGRVDITSSDTKARPAYTGDSLLVGDIVRTKSRARAEIEFNDGSIMRLASGSRIQINEYMAGKKKNRGIFSLFRGKVQNIVKKSRGFFGFKKENRYEVHTPTAVCGVRGTNYFSSYVRGTSNFVFKEGNGYGYNKNRPDQIMTIQAGQAMTVAAADLPPVVRVATQAEIDQHAQDTTPPENGDNGKDGGQGGPDGQGDPQGKPDGSDRQDNPDDGNHDNSGDDGQAKPDGQGDSEGRPDDNRNPDDPDGQHSDKVADDGHGRPGEQGDSEGRSGGGDQDNPDGYRADSRGEGSPEGHRGSDDGAEMRDQNSGHDDGQRPGDQGPGGEAQGYGMTGDRPEGDHHDGGEPGTAMYADNRQGDRDGDYGPRDGDYRGDRGGDYGPNDGSYRGDKGGDYGPNDGNYRGDMGGNYGPNDGSYRGDKGGDYGPNDGNYRGDMGGNYGPNDGSYRGDMGGNYGPNDGSYHGDMGGNYGPGDMGGNYGPNDGSYRGDMGGNYGPGGDPMFFGPGPGDFYGGDPMFYGPGPGDFMGGDPMFYGPGPDMFATDLFLADGKFNDQFMPQLMDFYGPDSFIFEQPMLPWEVEAPMQDMTTHYQIAGDFGSGYSIRLYGEWDEEYLHPPHPYIEILEGSLDSQRVLLAGVGGVWRSGVMEGDIFGGYVAQDGSAGLLTGLWNGSYAADNTWQSSWTSLSTIQLAPAGTVAYNGGDPFEDPLAIYYDSAPGRDFSAGAGTIRILNPDGGFVGGAMGSADKDWGALRGSINGTSTGIIDSSWHMAFDGRVAGESGNIERYQWTDLFGSQWSNEKIQGKLSGAWINISTAVTGVIGGNLNGFYMPGSVSDMWETIIGGAWLDTQRFLVMAGKVGSAPDLATLDKLKIPRFEIGRTNLSGNNGNLGVNMNNVIFFAYTAGQKPSIWATDSVSGNYVSNPAVGDQVLLNGAGFSNVAFKVDHWSGGAGGKWDAKVNGSGTVGGHAVNVIGGAAGSIDSAAAFSGTAAGAAR